MNNNFFIKVRAITLTVAMASVISCKGNDIPVESESYLDSSSHQLSFTSETGYKVISIGTNREIEAVPDSPWCTAQVYRGLKENTKDLRVNVSRNEVVGKERTAVSNAA